MTDILTSEVTKLDAILLKLDRIDALLTEFEPVLRAYLDPAASGPVAWAVRKRLGVNNGKS